MRRPIADLFVEVSLATWRFIDDAEAAGFSPREETITENLLVEIRRHAPDQVLVHKTGQLEEHATGADLALAIEVLPDLWLHALIQAKKLTRGEYREFRKLGALDQGRHLSSEAEAAGAAPIYLFYNGTREYAGAGDALPCGGCSREILVRADHGPPWSTDPSPSPAGCTVAPARVVIECLTSGRPAWSPASFADDTSPWECILCPFVGGAGRPTALEWPEWGPRGHITQPFDVRWLQPDPPRWAALLIEGALPTDDHRAPLTRTFAVIRQ